VDIGVHQDGLVHVSQLADRFVKDPHDVVKAGDIVKVRVVEVDLPRKRISLTMRREPVAAPAQSGQSPSAGPGQKSGPRSGPAPKERPQPAPSTAFAAAFAKLR